MRSIQRNNRWWIVCLRHLGDSSLAHSSDSHLNSHAHKDDAPYQFYYTPTSPLLFLYSALTHNPHKIHYDQDWSVAKEGQRGPLVHGPLTATLLVELAGQVEGKKLKEFNYRATSPMLLDEEIRMTGRWSEGGVLTLEAKQGTKVGMKATASFVWPYHVIYTNPFGGGRDLRLKFYRAETIIN